MRHHASDRFQLTMDAARSACLVLHGKAAIPRRRAPAVRTVRDEGLQVECPRDLGSRRFGARSLSEAVLAEGSGVVIAGGGDGTVNEVVAGLLEESDEVIFPTPTLAVLPLGTANDLASACRIPLEPAREPCAWRCLGRTPELMSAGPTAGTSSTWQREGSAHS